MMFLLWIEILKTNFLRGAHVISGQSHGDDEEFVSTMVFKLTTQWALGQRPIWPKAYWPGL